ncbi:MAG: carbohydrate binding domain-containing protein [Planctomycetota bacterium]
MQRSFILPLLLPALATVGMSATFGGELTSNGGFEAGDTSDWESFPTGASTFMVTGDANSGSFAGELDNQAEASGAVIKQANIGVGSVSPGDQVIVTFAAKGSAGPGGVAFAEFFSELAGGGVSSATLLGGGPLPLTSDWQTFCYTLEAGPDVSGGVTLQFVAATGAVMGSTSTILIDDASVVISELSTNGGFELGDTSGWEEFPTASSSFTAISDANSGSFGGLLHETNELTKNGGFETGDTTDWESFPTGSSVFEAIMDANSGTWGGRLANDDEASGAVIKQSNIGIGRVTPGQTVEISFAAKGGGFNGGVAFAEFFSELAGGGTSSAELLGGAPLALTSDWQTFNFTVTAGADTSGGVTLQFVAATAAISGSVSVIQLDDVSVKIAGGSGAVVKQANVGIGIVSPGDTVNVSFAAKGSSGVGGVAFAEFFSEIDGGGVSSATLLGGGPIAVTNDWQTFSYSVTAGPDVSGGVTLQFVAATGAILDSSMTLQLDDITITTTTGAVSNYCVHTPNSAGAGGVMGFSGSPSVAAQDFTLEASGLPANTFCLFFLGTESGFTPSFEGVNCIGGTVVRIGPILQSSDMGMVSRAMPDAVYTQFGATPPMVGTALNFQLAYRDNIGSGGNWTDALCVVFGE